MADSFPDLSELVTKSEIFITDSSGNRPILPSIEIAENKSSFGVVVPPLQNGNYTVNVRLGTNIGFANIS